MSASGAALRRQRATAAELHTVVRTMKAMAAGNISQYEQAVAALAGYDDTVQRGLQVCLRVGPQQGEAATPAAARTRAAGPLTALVFGTDQGMVAGFNEDMALHVAAELRGRDAAVWVVGQRLAAALGETALTVARQFELPATLAAIAPLLAQVLVAFDAQRGAGGAQRLEVFHQRQTAEGGYAPVRLRLLPLDAGWRAGLAARPWPGKQLPQVVGAPAATLAELLNEYLFVSLYRACAESQASENAARLAAMARAEKNIGTLIDTLERDYHRQRQSSVDAELFDLVAGFEALATR